MLALVLVRGLLHARGMRLSVLVALLFLGCNGNSLLVDGSPDGSVGDQGSVCAGLDETTCLARPACTVDYCNECSCRSTFVGCRAPTAAKTVCPALGCDQPECCTASSACGTDFACFQPGQRGGAQPTCIVDSDCAADGDVCVQSSCHPPACGAGAAQPTCPSNFTCVLNKTGSRCARDTCTANNDCHSGAFCVGGACFHDEGSCGPPVP